ncbi:hypothetical protein CWR43_22495 [Rhizobium sullae]|nr:hypothetical protein CWR43_22495 [Rhizobium sullae]
MWEKYTDKYKAYKLVALPIAAFGTTASIMSVAFYGDVSISAKQLAFGCAMASAMVTAIVSFLELVADARQKERRAAEQLASDQRIEQLEVRIRMLEQGTAAAA